MKIENFCGDIRLTVNDEEAEIISAALKSRAHQYIDNEARDLYKMINHMIDDISNQGSPRGRKNKQ